MNESSRRKSGSSRVADASKSSFMFLKDATTHYRYPGDKHAAEK